MGGRGAYFAFAITKEILTQSQNTEKVRGAAGEQWMRTVPADWKICGAAILGQNRPFWLTACFF